MLYDNESPAKIAYSIKEACQATSLSRATIYRQIAAGRLTARRIAGRTVLTAESLHALIADAPSSRGEPGDNR